MEVHFNTNKWIVCRICLKSSDNAMVKIFDFDAPVEHLVDKIADCGGIKLDSMADLPDSICCKCLTLLKAAHKFRGLCQRSKLKLERLLVQSPVIHVQDEEESPVIDEIEEKSTVTTETTFELLVKKEEETEFIDDLEEDDMLENMYIEVRDPEEEYFMSYDSIDQFEIVKQNDDSVNTEENIQFTYVEEGEQEDVIEIVEPKTKVRIIPAKDSSNHDADYKIVPKYNTTVKAQPRKRKPNVIANKSSAVVGEEEPSYICCHCGNMYNEKAKLTLHLKNHTKEKPHECEICHKRFAQTPQLARHMNSHTGSRPFKCKFCSASFADPSTCIKHQRIHTNERPYKCETCGKSFSYSNVLKVHMMTHTGEKPYSCEHCGKKFAQLHHKKAHERTHNHEVDLVEDSLNN